jgi:CheY-like chemotaxis protein
MTRQDVEILLVEDNPDDLELTLHALNQERLANHIEVARDGEEALDFLLCRGPCAHRSFEQAPRVVLLDLRLPKVEGMEVLREIKKDPRTKAIPIVILTTSGEESDLVNGYDLGANGYIQKPVDFDNFRNVVKQLGLYWLVVNEPPPPAAFRAK